MPAAAMKHPRVVPTRVQLERAFARMRLTSWPATLEEALADHKIERLLLGLAVNIARQEMQHAQPLRPLLRNPRPPYAVRTGRPQCAQPGPTFDPKKAAANDRDDD